MHHHPAPQAGRASGEEQEDLQQLAERLDEMALSDEASEVLDVTFAFFEKYKDECGVPPSP